MEEVKDTLWKWFIQLTGLLGLGCATYVFFANFVPYALRLRSERYPDLLLADVLAVATCVLVPGLVCFKLVALKKWAGWVVCAALWLFTVKVGGWLLLCLQLWPFSIPSALFLTHVMLFSHALIFKPKLWRGGF